MMMRLECWSDVEEEEPCLFILSICISLTQLSDGVGSSHAASLSLMELEISLNNSDIVKEEISTSVEQDTHSYSAFH